MRRGVLLHAELSALLSHMGHTQTVCIADAGLPIPKGVRCIDVSVMRGIPAFADVLNAIWQEGVFESCVLASEIAQSNAAVHRSVLDMVGDCPVSYVPHEAFKQLTADALCIIRTGECSPYANILLTGGVDFP